MLVGPFFLTIANHGDDKGLITCRDAILGATRWQVHLVRGDAISLAMGLTPFLFAGIGWDNGIDVIEKALTALEIGLVFLLVLLPLRLRLDA